MKNITIFMIVMLLCSNAMAYNPNSFEDSEEITVIGQRPKVDIEVSEIEVRISVDDFVDGVATKTIQIDNDGSVPCHLAVSVGQVPVDLLVGATVDDDFLLKGETTNLNITVELSDQQEEEEFVFTILVKASLHP